MKDIREGQDGSKRGLMTYALWCVALIGVAAAVYVIAPHIIKPSGRADMKALARGEMAKLEIAAKGAPPPALTFLDPAGHPARLADLTAPVVVLNLWATWCAPCVKEMPTLATLQAAYKGRILVVPVSMDKAADREKARAFIAGYPPLPFYQDPHYGLAFALSPPAEGFPTTVIYDKKGVERARLAGGADWNGADAHAIFDALLAEP
jgi:thiol-disulfide isomerase/thioredoxin